MPTGGILPSLEVRGTGPFRLCSYHHEKNRLIDTNCGLKQDERHSYEKCQYEEFKKRVAKMDELRAAKDGARSN